MSITVLIEFDENLDGESKSKFKSSWEDEFISTDVNPVRGDIGDEAASILCGGCVVGLNKRASTEAEVVKTSAVVTVLFLWCRWCLLWYLLELELLREFWSLGWPTWN